ncbi:uncharacterized protein LOC128677773 isoform X1 [Plodia interpunctella]|uniref:uncharacterized protein LOC128677773 isoform X1 n=1 Tax=Plodia interpunctella TaxID=58824 RepID=UPI0023680442|nr:uncharacterized protein LOC128677773 isoform X1 [Plodia interpunctella]
MALKTICLLLVAFECHAYPFTGFPNNFGSNQNNGHNLNTIEHVHGSYGNQHHFEGFGLPNSFAYGHFPGSFQVNQPGFSQNQDFNSQNHAGFGQNHGYLYPNKDIFGPNQNEFSHSGNSPISPLKSRSNVGQLVEILPSKPFEPVPFDESKAFPRNIYNHGLPVGQGGFSNYENSRPVPSNFAPAAFIQNHGSFGPYNSFGQNPGYFGQNHDGFAYAHGFDNFGHGLNQFSQGGQKPNFQQIPRKIEEEPVGDALINSDSVPSEEFNVIAQSDDHHHHGHGHHGFGPDFNNQQAFGQDKFGQNIQGFWPGQYGPWYGPNGFAYWHGPWLGQNGYGPWQVPNGLDQDNLPWPCWFGHDHGHNEEPSAEPDQDVNDDSKPDDDQPSVEDDAVPSAEEETTEEINVEETE